MTAVDAEEQTSQVLYRVRDVVRLTTLSRSEVYEQLRAGRLRSVRQGRARLVTAKALSDYVRLLEREAEQKADQ
ncbi:MAG: DNA-binding protein [Nocardiopsaceae bacterium]|nr:DNA-binding protein [Nocardiopsaceae bacterium]